MKILNLLNPTEWLGQILVLSAFILLGIVIGQHTAPAKTVVKNDVDIKNKARRGGTVSSGGLEPLDCDCDDYIRGRSMKELRDIRKD